MPNPLGSADAYSQFIHELPVRYSSILRSTLRYIPMGAKIGKTIGLILFDNGLVLCVQEFLNLELQVIEGYGYEASRPHASFEGLPEAEEYCRASYDHKDKLWWYDSFPHPNDSSLASTHPHHKHIQPDIKRHRIPAPDLTFTAPNLPYIIEEIISG